MGESLCRLCGRPVIMAWIGRTLTTLDAEPADVTLFGDDYARHVCNG